MSAQLPSVEPSEPLPAPSVEARLPCLPEVPPVAPTPAVTLRERLWLRRLRRGDARAFELLVRTYQHQIYELIVRMVGDRQEAEDLVQEVFLSVHENLGRFRGDSRLSTWLYRVAKNHCLNRLKYMGRRERGRSTEISEVPESVLEEQQPSGRPDDQAELRQKWDAVQRALSTLDEEQRLIVVLRDIEGLSYEEIAAITEQPQGTVKSRLHRARLALAEAVASADETRSRE